MFLLKIRELHKVSQKALDGLVTDITSLFQQKLFTLQKDLQEYLSASGLSMSEIDGLEALFNKPELSNPFKGLQSKFLQEKSFREDLGVLVRILN